MYATILQRTPTIFLCPYMPHGSRRVLQEEGSSYETTSEEEGAAPAAPQTGHRDVRRAGPECTSLNMSNDFFEYLFQNVRKGMLPSIKGILF